MTICLSPSGDAISSSQGPSSDVFVGTADGVVLLYRPAPGQAWNIVRQTLAGYHVCSLAYEHSTGMLLAGTHNGGVAISWDMGASWTFKNQGLTSTDVYSVAHVGAGSALKLYAGVEPAGLFVSDDLGESWRELASLRAVPSAAQWNFPSPPHIAHVKHITFAPDDPDHIYACIEQGEMLSSPDGGASWEELLRNADAQARCDGDAHRVILRTSKPNEIFMPTGCGLLHSYDNGRSWADESDRIAPMGYPDVMVFDPDRQDVLFIAGARAHPGEWFADRNAAAKVARSRDGGASWQFAVNGLPEPLTANIEAMTLEAFEGTCAVFIATTSGDVYCSENEGETWSKIADGLPPISKGGHFGILSGAF
jgi:photosystem II stability/assembly factor-like uncharacterized protein